MILTGMAADICVLFSANDTYMRDFQIHIPSDCVASESDERTRSALLLMQRVLKASISPSTALQLENLVVAAKADKPQPIPI